MQKNIKIKVDRTEKRLDDLNEKFDDLEDQMQDQVDGMNKTFHNSLSNLKR